jgi:putative ABC transport system permease protein
VQAGRGIGPGNAQVVYGNLNWATQIQGVTPSYFEARDWPVDEGRAVLQEGRRRRDQGRAARPDDGAEPVRRIDPLGQIIRIKKVPFTVIGILSRKGQNSWGQDQDDIILVPLSTRRRRCSA